MVVGVRANKHTTIFDIETNGNVKRLEIPNYKLDNFDYDNIECLRPKASKRIRKNSYVDYAATVNTEKVFDLSNNVSLDVNTNEIDEVDFGSKNPSKSHPKANAHVSVKISVIGNKGIGKSSLVQALLSSNGISGDEDQGTESDGIKINTSLTKDGNLKIFDIAENLDFFECHSLFMTANTLYLLCFDVRDFSICSEKTKTVSIVEKWLELISVKAPNSRVIIVATNIDNDAVNNDFLEEVWANIREVLKKSKGKHNGHILSQKLHNCLLCQEKEISRKICGKMVGSVFLEGTPSESCLSTSDFPHVVGYFEISNRYKMPRCLSPAKNKSVIKLRGAIISVAKEMLKSSGSAPDKWKWVQKVLGSFEENFIDFDNFYNRIQKLRIFSTVEEVTATLSFYHSQGEILFFDAKQYSDKFIISNIRWLSSQLSKLSSYNDPNGNIERGFIPISQFDDLFKELSLKNRKNLFLLLNDAGYFVEIDSTKTMVPSSLPIGMPNLDKWPLHHSQKQYNLLFRFDELPRAFFPHLIARVQNLNSNHFTGKMKPNYTQNNIVYNTAIPCKTCSEHREKDYEIIEKKDVSYAIIEEKHISKNEDQRHRVNFKLLQQRHEIILSVLGPTPRCIANELVELLKKIQCEYFRNAAMDYCILCGVCVTKCYPDPCYFTEKDISSNTPICEKGHDLRSWQNLKNGIYEFQQQMTIRNMTDVLHDSECPKLFLITPANAEKVGLKKYVYDNYVLQFLCEHPDSWHVTGLSYELKFPNEFLKKHGERICALFSLLSKLETPLRLSGNIAGDIAGIFGGLGKLADKGRSFLYDFKDKYDFCENLATRDFERYLSADDNLSRRELRKFLNEVDEGNKFGDLNATLIGNKIYWLCKEHANLYQYCE